MRTLLEIHQEAEREQRERNAAFRQARSERQTIEMLTVWTERVRPGISSFEETVEIIATQHGWNGQTYGGVRGGARFFWGGLEEGVLANLLSVLGRRVDNEAVQPARVLKGAMARNPELASFVEAVLKGIDIVGRDLDEPTEKVIADILVG